MWNKYQLGAWFPVIAQSSLQHFDGQSDQFDIQ
jgi:hypothetical protein